MEHVENGSFWVGAWHVQPPLNRVTNGTTVQVEPRVMAVLVCLAETPGEVVSRETLLEQVWADTYVGEEALTRAISELRKAFGDDPREPRVIETIRKMGYRLIAPVSQRGAMEAPPGAPGVSGRPPKTHWRIFSWAASLTILVAALGWIVSATRPEAAAGTFPQTRPFTSYPGIEAHPALSPDGNRVAFTSDMKGALNLFVKQVETETPLQVTNSAASDVNPAWSPDGQQIAFARLDADGCSLLTVPALGGAVRRLAACGPHSYPDVAWSSDGAWLAFTSRDDPQTPHHVRLLSLETLEDRPLTEPPASYYGDEFIAFSPDATELAFVRTNIFGIMDLYIVPVTGGVPRRLTFDDLKIRGLAWSADGKDLFFSSNRTVSYNVWKVTAKGGAPRLVEAGDHYGLSFAQPARRLVYEKWYADTNIWRLANPLMATQEVLPQRFISSTQWDSYPQISPEGSRVAFASDREGTPEVWMSDSDGANPVQLTSVGGPFVSMPRWSPDGAHLVFNSRAQGNADVYVVEVAGGLPRRLTSHPALDVAANWSHDGQWIYFASNRSGSWQVWKAPSEGGDPVQVTQGGGYAAAESYDGQDLYYTKQSLSGLWRRPIGGGPETLVLERLDPGHWSQWVLARRGLYFLQERAEGGPAILFYDWATEVIQHLADVPVDHNYSGLSVSPDESWLLYAQIDQRGSDLMLVEHFQ